LKEAIKAGVDWVEFDVKVLTDGMIVSLHDGTVDRTTDGQGDITKMNWEQVQKLNAGKGYDFGLIHVPKVEEILAVLSSCGRVVRAEMHIHNLWEPEPLIALLDKYKLRDRCYFNLNAMIMGIYMREDLHDATSLISLNAQGDSPELKDLCNKYDMSYLCIPPNFLNADYINRIHAFRKKNPVFVQCYPVNDEPGWQRMIDIGVDVIQTDYPEALFEYLEDHKADLNKKK
nr:glycerophosphodiester phosphodiesterase family protein [Candidatus Sigynarchaeota archaeon]